MVAIMNESLELSRGLKVLEIGAGSGYHAATIAETVSPTGEESSGRVITVESEPELAKLAEKNLRETGYLDRVTVVHGDGSVGYEKEAPYDRILVTASAPDVPQPLITQLATGGILLIPLGGHEYYQDLMKLRKRADGSLNRQSLGAVAFVPLHGRYGFPE